MDRVHTERFHASVGKLHFTVVLWSKRCLQMNRCDNARLGVDEALHFARLNSDMRSDLGGRADWVICFLACPPTVTSRWANAPPDAVLTTLTEATPATEAGDGR